MFSSILIAILTLAGGISLYQNWDSFTKWCKDFIHAVAHLFKTLFKGVARATAIFVRITADGWAELTHKTYAPMEDGKYGEVTVVKTAKPPQWVVDQINSQVAQGKTKKLTEQELQQLGLMN